VSYLTDSWRISKTKRCAYLVCKIRKEKNKELSLQSTKMILL